MIGFSIVVGLAAGGLWSLRQNLRRRRSEQRRATVRASVAPVVDLVAVVLGAGGTIAEAVALVAEEGPAPTRDPFGSVITRQRRGELLSDALQSLSSELGSPFHPLTAALVSAELGGASVGVLLQRLAEEAQQARARTLADALGRLPVALLVPLVVCQLPALVIGSVIPLTIVAVRQLGW